MLQGVSEMTGDFVVFYCQEVEIAAFSPFFPTKQTFRAVQSHKRLGISALFPVLRRNSVFLSSFRIQV